MAAIRSKTVSQLTLSPIRWLWEPYLPRGSRMASELYAAAADAGIPERTLDRAKAELRIGSRKAHFKDRSVWYWYDSSSDWPKDAPFKKPRPGEMPDIMDMMD